MIGLRILRLGLLTTVAAAGCGTGAPEPSFERMQQAVATYNDFQYPWASPDNHPVLQSWNGLWNYSACNMTNGGHKGQMAWAWDFSMPLNTPILASKSGTVSAADMKTTSTNRYTDPNCPGVDCWVGHCSCCANYGNRVTVQNDDHTATLYLHLYAVSVAPQQHVSVGDQLGLSGQSGMSCAVPHLHYQVQDPGIWITQSRPSSFEGAAIPASSSYGNPACGASPTSHNTAGVTCPGSGNYCGSVLSASLISNAIYSCSAGAKATFLQQCSGACAWDGGAKGLAYCVSGTPAPTCPTGGSWGGAGNYCWNDGVSNAAANHLYSCASAGGAASDLGNCGEGCHIMPIGSPDQCYSGSCPTGGNWGGVGPYCGRAPGMSNAAPNIVYHCPGAGAKGSIQQVCGGNCVVAPVGHPDHC